MKEGKLKNNILKKHIRSQNIKIQNKIGKDDDKKLIVIL